MIKAFYVGLMSLVMLGLVSLVLMSKPASASRPQTTAASNIEMINYLGGSVEAEYIAGDYAYLAQGSALAVINVANPAMPVVVGQTAPLPGQATAIYVAAGYAYVLVANQLVIVDIRNPAQPTLIGSINVGYSINVMQGAQNRIYILSKEWDQHYVYLTSLHLIIVDISNPVSPQIVGSHDVVTGNWNTNANGLFVVGTTVYLATGNLGLHIMDASNPQQVVELGSYYDYTHNDYAQSVFVSGTIAYLSMGSYQPGLKLLNVSSPASPTLMSILTDTIKEVMVAGSLAYAIGYDSQLRLIDVSQPYAPIEVGVYDAGATISDLSMVGDRAYLTSGTGVLMLNIGNAPVITPLGRYDSPWSISGLEIAGSMAYIIDSGRLAVLDIHQPLSPTRIGIYPQLHDISLMKISDHIAYVVDSGHDLHLLDVTNPITPTAIGVYTSSRNHPAFTSLAVESQTVYLAKLGISLDIIDAANPVAPTLVSTYPVDAYDVAVANGLAYVLTGDGVHIIDVRQPLTPTLVTTYSIPTNYQELRAGKVRVFDNKVYATTDHIFAPWNYFIYSSILTILDVSNPVNPVLLGSYEPPTPTYGAPQAGLVSDFIVIDDLIFAANRIGGLRVLNVSDPSHVVEGAAYQTGMPATNVAITNQLIYAVDGGLYILTQNPLTMTGQVANHYLSPMANVTLEADNGSTTMSGIDGRYLFTGLTWGTHVVTPTLTGYVFIPLTRTVTLPPSVTAQDFMMLPAPVSTTLTPGDFGYSLSYTDTQGLLTRLDFPPNAVSTTLTLVLTPTLVSQIRDWAFAGHAFDIAVYEANVLQTAFTFSESVTVTLQYSSRDVSLVSDQTHLELRQWLNGNWQSTDQSCSSLTWLRSHTSLQSGTFSGTLCATGRFALFGPTNQVYLPLVLRNAN